ncbi:MAG: hypothetical protein R3C14_54315 [Caldilineaceae bacterium]
MTGAEYMEAEKRLYAALCGLPETATFAEVNAAMTKRYLGATEPTEEPEPGPTEAQLAKRRAMAVTLCYRAGTPAAWALADKLVRAWELGGCEALGCKKPE